MQIVSTVPLLYRHYLLSWALNKFSRDSCPSVWRFALRSRTYWTSFLLRLGPSSQLSLTRSRPPTASCQMVVQREKIPWRPRVPPALQTIEDLATYPNCSHPCAQTYGSWTSMFYVLSDAWQGSQSAGDADYSCGRWPLPGPAVSDATPALKSRLGAHPWTARASAPLPRTPLASTTWSQYPSTAVRRWRDVQQTPARWSGTKHSVPRGRSPSSRRRLSWWTGSSPQAEACRLRTAIWASPDSERSSRMAHSAAGQLHATAINLNISRKLWGHPPPPVCAGQCLKMNEEGEMVNLPPTKPEATAAAGSASPQAFAPEPSLAEAAVTLSSCTSTCRFMSGASVAFAVLPYCLYSA